MRIEPPPNWRRWPTRSCSATGSLQAIAAAERALEASQARDVRFLAARVLIEAGAPQPAKRIAVALGNDLLPEAQALASILDGMIALADGDNRNAVRFLTEANTLLDTWIGHFELGRAYLRANASCKRTRSSIAA